MAVERSADRYSPQRVYICDYCNNTEEFEESNHWEESREHGWRRSKNGLDFCTPECQKEYFQSHQYVSKEKYEQGMNQFANFLKWRKEHPDA